MAIPIGIIEKKIGAGLAATGIGVGGFALATHGIREDAESLIKSGDWPDIDLGETKVSIHVSTLNEEPWIEETLKSIVMQEVYSGSDKVEIVLVDSNSEDRTVEIATPYVDKVLTVPSGKITARRVAIEKTDAGIIVSADAGDYYPQGWLNLLLRHFEDPGVVAVSGNALARSKWWEWWNWWEQIGAVWSIVFVNPYILMGRNMAIRRNAFFESGGWDESIDQTNMAEIWPEEEWKFHDKMEKIGKVVYDNYAVCYEVARRFRCDGESPEIAAYCRAIRSGKRM